MDLLKYVQDENFGQYGESIKLIDTINEFINKLTVENQKLEDENQQL